MFQSEAQCHICPEAKREREGDDGASKRATAKTLLAAPLPEAASAEVAV